MWFYIILGILLLVLVAYLMREKRPDTEGTDNFLKDYNDAYARYKETNSDEDYHKYQALKKAYEIQRDLKKRK